MSKKIPVATTKRLPVYYRFFSELMGRGVLKISSSKLAEGIQIDPATIRRDFSHFGTLGRRGYGYDVEKMLTLFKEILDQDVVANVALIGVGNLGHALLNYNFRQSSNMRISAAFDSNPELIGTLQSDVPVYDVSRLVEQLKIQQIQVAIVTVPSEKAHAIVDELLAAGIKGIMNFTAERIAVPKGVRIKNVDLTSELQSLIFDINHDKN